VNEQLARTPKDLPTLFIAVNKKIADFVVDDFILENYNPDPAIKADMAV
jgi:thymidylate synthase